MCVIESEVMVFYSSVACGTEQPRVQVIQPISVSCATAGRQLHSLPAKHLLLFLLLLLLLLFLLLLLLLLLPFDLKSFHVSDIRLILQFSRLQDMSARNE